METIVSTEGLSKEYGGVFRVKHVDLQIREGEVYGFLGPNGAGKSTTMKMLLGLVKPTQGTVHLFGKQMNDKNRVEILRQTGALIESPSYYGHLTGMENLRVMQKLLDIPEKNLREALFLITGETPETPDESQTPSTLEVIDPKTYLEETLMQELDAADFYRNFFLAVPDGALRDLFFEILTDKQSHANALTYLFSKYF